MHPLWLFSLLCFSANARAPPGPWDRFNYAPLNRTVRPKVFRGSGGNVETPEQLVPPHDGSATLIGNGSYVVLDFGQEVGGVVSLTINKASPQSSLSLSFTESSEFVDPFHSDDSCRAVPTMDSDGTQTLPFPLSPGIFTQTIGEQRGGFKYLTIVSNDNGPLTISNVSVHTTWMPHWDDLRAYTGYFFAHDPVFRDPGFLTKLWYAGAYTVQTNTIDSHQARQQPCPSPAGWANNASGGPVDGPILVDGAKRDRCALCFGDVAKTTFVLTVVITETSGQLVALNDLLPTKNSLAVMFSTQNPNTGSLQYSGPPINAKGSDTYIGWSLIGTYNYYLYTGDLDFVRLIWGNYTKALAFLEGQVDSTGLMNVPRAFSNDWGRDNGQGHNSAANAILYQALVTAADLAARLGFVDLAATYIANATALKSAYNNLLWDGTAGMFRDNPTSTLHPQDGNSLAVLFNVTNQQSQKAAISEGLTSFWTEIGPLSPELNDTIIPFVGGFEVQAHFIAGQGERALDLLHRESSLLEGFTLNGSLGYRAAAGYQFDHSYTSHSHGWATGPTPALTFFVLGLTLTSAQGATWSLAPVLSGLDAAEGGLTTDLGWFGVKWEIRANKLMLLVDVPKGTRGIIRLPGTRPTQVEGEASPLTLHKDGKLEIEGGKYTLIQDGSTFDCRVTSDGVKFDLTSLAGEHTASRKRETPPTSTADILRFDLCAELERQEGVAENDQCARGTRACFTQINYKANEEDRIISAIPLMSASRQDLTFKAGTPSPKYITIISTGAEYPPSNATPIHPSLNLTILCSGETSDPVFKSFDGLQVVVEWSAPAGCNIEGDTDGGHNDSGGVPDNKPPQDDKTESTGSGIGWFFLVLILAFAAYFGLGAYYNYTTYGARGADLLPHRDFWKEVPYMLSDVIDHLCSSGVEPEASTGKFHFILNLYSTMARKVKKWSEVAPLVSGVPGAIHESFNTVEEANHSFAQARDNGVVKVVKCGSDESEPCVGTPKMPPSHEDAQASPSRSSPRALEISELRRSPRLGSPSNVAEASMLPRVSHPNVTYTPGPSSSPSHIPLRVERRTTSQSPHVIVRTPSDIPSYPSDTEGPSSTALSGSCSQNLSPGRQTLQQEFRHISSTSTPMKTSQAMDNLSPVSGVAMPRTTPYSMQSPVLDSLSPLDYPQEFLTPENMPPLASKLSMCGDHSSASQSSPESPSCPMCGFIVELEPTCVPKMKKETALETLLDPRSPLNKPGFKFGSQFSYESRGRPSPVQLPNEFDLINLEL
ncbi:hypothetical protein C0995_016691 [Termitomyces sp. Mi166|nr:hypothetical protein C0995_016691 [Termitomyces sp. Mi166\